MVSGRNLVLAFLVVFMFGCITQQKVNKTNIKENFEEFSRKFYTDSQFQLSRISFPLKGQHNIDVPVKTTNLLGDSLISGWKKKDWIILKNSYFPNNESVFVIENTTYLRKTQKRAKSVTIVTYIENSGFSITEKYALKNGKWYLVYFSSLSY